MADVIYKKGQSSNLDNVQIKEGQILVTEDTGEMYVDVTNSDRKKINSVSNSKSGSAILIDDVSPVTHEMGVKVRTNLFNKEFLVLGTGTSNLVQIDNGFSFQKTTGERTSTYVSCDIYLEKGAYHIKSTVTKSDNVGGGGIALRDKEKALNIFNDSSIGNSDRTFSIEDSKAYSLNFYAPYISAANTTTTFTDVQLEYGESASPYMPYVDPTSVTVSRCGKNLFDTINAVKLNGASNFSITNNAITVSQNSNYNYASANVLIPQSLIGKTVTISAKSNTSGANVAGLRIQWVSDSGGATGDMILGRPDSAGNIVVTGTVPTQPDETHNNLCLMLYSNSTGTLETGTTYTATYSDIQIELGSTATDYERYIAPTEYTPAADGTVNGVTSLYPNTTLMTDTESVYIDCEYLTKNYKYVLDNRIPKQTQSDWQQNDETANDYVKNRPGGYDGLTAILPETTLNFSYDSGLYLPNLLIELDKKYTVTFDNTEYELVGRNDPRDRGGVYIGNEIHAWGTDTIDTGEPFVIYTDMFDDTTIYISSSTTLPCTHNIKIKAIAPVKIDEKYLDIKNTNIVNGSKTGSLRTVGSAEESSEYTIGTNAFAEGNGTKASGDYSHAEGQHTTASGYISHAEGFETEASGDYSHTEGYDTQALGFASHAEGMETTASGNYSHAEGGGTTASGGMSHAEGDGTIASGDAAHSEGKYTQAKSDYQHVQGILNIIDEENKYADIVGNGKEYNETRSNAYTLDWSGNAWYAGDVYVGSTSGVNKDEGSKKLATEKYVDLAISSSGGLGVVVDTALSSTSENPVQNKVINTALNNKVDKVSGKGLSTNDYTTAEKNKLAGIATGANKTIVDSTMSNTSTNPVQNRVIKSELDKKAPISHTNSPLDIIDTTVRNLSGKIDYTNIHFLPNYKVNMLYGFKPSAITVEYSTDGGATWVDYGLTDAQKYKLFQLNEDTGLYLGKHTSSTNKSSNDQLRISLDFSDDARYVAISELYHWITTMGNTMTLTVQGANYSDPSTFVDIATDISLSGWSGPNMLSFPLRACGGSTPTNIKTLRLTYKQTVESNNYGSAAIHRIGAFGTCAWGYSSDSDIRIIQVYGDPYKIDLSAKTVSFAPGFTVKVGNSKDVATQEYVNSKTISITDSEIDSICV